MKLLILCAGFGRTAKLLAEWIEADSRFELSAPVVMGVICFRLIAPDPATADKLNSALVEKVNTSGQAYVNQTKLKGRTVARVGLGNVLTTEKHVRNVWELIRAAADKLCAETRQ